MDVVRHLTARSTGPALAVFIEALDGTDDERSERRDAGKQQSTAHYGWTEAKVAELLQLSAGLTAAKVAELLQLGALYAHKPNRQGAMVLSRALDPNAIVSKGTYLRAYVLPKRFPNPTHPTSWLVAMDQDLCVIDKPPNVYVVQCSAVQCGKVALGVMKRN